MRFAQPGTPWRKRVPKVQIMHAFQETGAVQQKEHLRTFFGHIPGEDDQYDEEIGSYVICYCGGRLTPISIDKQGDIQVAAVWHNTPKVWDDGYDC